MKLIKTTDKFEYQVLFKINFLPLCKILIRMTCCRYKGSQSDTKEWMVVEKRDKGWTDQEPRRASGASSSSSSSEPHRARESAPAAADGMEAQKKFGSAKAISSDQFFQDSRDNDVSNIFVLMFLNLSSFYVFESIALS